MGKISEIKRNPHGRIHQARGISRRMRPRPQEEGSQAVRGSEFPRMEL